MIRDSAAIGVGGILRPDVCIIGAGVAGLAIAREFFHHRESVLLLEGGGLNFDTDSQNIYRGNNEGSLGTPDYLHVSRLRYLGGTTNHWSGYCARLEADDFVAREWIPWSGWPITLEDIEPYYLRSRDVLSLIREDAEDLAGELDLAHDPFHVEGLSDIEWLISQAPNLRINLQQQIADSHNVELLTQANAVRLERNAESGRLQSVHCRRPDGQGFEVQAGSVVMACGGIENARLLLASPQSNGVALGNRYDLVGRFFMEHPHDRSCSVLFTDPVIERLFSARTTRSLVPGLRLDDHLLTARRLLKTAFVLEHLEPAEEGIDPAEVRLAASLAHAGKARRMQVYLRAEQAPNPNSRVTLSEEPDALGSPRARLDWQLTELDYLSMRDTALQFAGVLSASGLARLNVPSWMLAWPDSGETPRFFGGFHHMGTTRMANSPHSGVVDRQCRLWGCDNFYIAGSSVFPTCGWANPTMTLTALAIRIADHIKADLLAVG